MSLLFVGKLIDLMAHRSALPFERNPTQYRLSFFSVSASS